MNYKGTMVILFSSVFLIAGCTNEAVTTEQKKVEVKTTTHTNQKTNQTNSVEGKYDRCRLHGSRPILEFWEETMVDG